MVKPAQVNGRAAHYCEVCLLAYSDRPTAERCEEFCSTHEGCSLEIGRQAIGAVEAA